MVNILLVKFLLRTGLMLLNEYSIKWDYKFYARVFDVARFICSGYAD